MFFRKTSFLTSSLNAILVRAYSSVKISFFNSSVLAVILIAKEACVNSCSNTSKARYSFFVSSVILFFFIFFAAFFK